MAVTRRSLALCFAALCLLMTSHASTGMAEAATTPTSSAASGFHSSSYLNYTAIPGFFLQDDPSTNASTFSYTSTNFGLIPRTYSTDPTFDPRGRKAQWQRFGHYVSHLNALAPPSTQYKLLYLGRHGEGYHNTAEAFYGTPLWNCYWSLQPGNATTNWTDARLTPSGVSQARIAHDFWAHEIATQKIPVPQSYYVSPLTRCLSTAQITFANLSLPREYPFVPTVKELLREGIGLHTCDERSSRTFIHAAYPHYRIERGFTETDELWRPNLRESSSAQAARLRTLLNDVFAHDAHEFISFTSHSGSIASILSVIGHRAFSLSTGAVIPVLVKAEWIGGAAPSSSIAPSTGAPTCTSNPTATQVAARAVRTALGGS